MFTKIVFYLFAYVTLLLLDKMLQISTEHTRSAARSRIFKFSLLQDLLVILSILKMIVFEGMSLASVMYRIMNSGLTTRVYIASSVVLHCTVLLDEATNHYVRLNPQSALSDSITEIHVTEIPTIAKTSSSSGMCLARAVSPYATRSGFSIHLPNILLGYFNGVGPKGAKALIPAVDVFPCVQTPARPRDDSLTA